MLIRNACIVTLDDANRVFDRGTVQICPDGTIGFVGKEAPAAEDAIVDAGGKLLMPALINGHTHLYSTLARGMTLRGRPPENFRQVLKKLWWRLDAALTPEDVYYSALVGLIESAKSGVGTLMDHHSSPHACPGSLDVIERAFREVGLRGVLCYETSDRNGAAGAAEAIAENVRFAAKARRHGGTIGATFGLHASFTLSDRTLRKCVEAAQSVGAGFHVHIAEDRCDVEDAHARCGKTPVQRLSDLGALNQKTIAAHCVHVTLADMALLARQGVNVVHNPQSNCNNAVGIAKVPALLRRSVLVGLGSDGYSPRIWEEFMTACHVQQLRARNLQAGASQAYTLALLNNRKMVKKVWGWNLGRIEPGAPADLVLFDYFPPTPLRAENLPGHALFGIAHAAVDTLVVNGKLVVLDHQCVTTDERAVAERAAARARKLWQRL
jgi:putative selenium metabolism protein SsnA